MELEEQKSSYEQKARESLQRVLEEKMGAEQQLESTQVSSNAERAAGWASTQPAYLPTPCSALCPQRSLAQAKQQCVEWRERYESLHKDWSHLQDRQGELEQQLQALKSRMQVSSQGCQGGSLCPITPVGSPQGKDAECQPRG